MSDEASDYAQTTGDLDLTLELSAFESHESNTPNECFDDAVRDVLKTISTFEAPGSAQPSSAVFELDSTFDDAVSV